MDSSVQDFSPQANACLEGGVPQRSLKRPIGCVGKGPGKRKVAMTLRPALPDSGIVFRRTDLGLDIPAWPALGHGAKPPVMATRQGAPVIGVEPVLAALAERGITNAVVELDGAEVPAVDGAASDFMFLIDCAGSITQATATAEMPRAA